MSTPDLAYIVFSIMTLALMACLIYISYLQHQNAELSSVVMEQDALLDAYDRHAQDDGEYIRELSTAVMEQDALLDMYDRHAQDNSEYIRKLSVQLEAASERANEYRTELRDIDNQLQCDPIQFLFTNEEIHHG